MSRTPARRKPAPLSPSRAPSRSPKLATSGPVAAHFRVDTHVFRELGELLVGRDSTALMELVKNSYDADASRVIVYGEQLQDSVRGLIRIVDDGTGMTHDQFVNGFLTIASRVKGDDNRYSAKHGRRYTGAKGIGRLAAHKLARTMQVVSVAKIGASRWSRIEASIHWDEIEKHRLLEDTGRAVQIQVTEQRSPMPTGTAITLEHLRTRWNDARRDQFVLEATSFEPPNILSERIDVDCVSAGMLLPSPVYRDARKKAKFKLSLEGDFGAQVPQYETLLAEAAWILEVDAIRPSRIRVSVTPTARTEAETPGAERREFIINAKTAQRSPPSFQARILIRHGQSSLRDRLPYGVRVFMEGFRVLPYGAPGDDWLRLDADTVRRLRGAPRGLLPIDGLSPAESDSDTFLTAVSQRQYFGAVFLREASAGGLQMLVNREGFIPDNSFYDLVDVLRTAVYLSVRVRAGLVQQRRQQREPRKDAYGALRKATEDLKVILDALPSGEEATKALNGAVAALYERATDVARASDQINVLASIGALTAAFVHEISSVVGMAKSLESDMENLLADVPMRDKLRPRVMRLARQARDMRRQFEQQSLYLTDVISADARNRRSPQPIRERFNSAETLLLGAITKARVSVENDIPVDAYSSNMYPAELVSVMMNLLSNAVKAVGKARKGSRIRATSNVGEDGRLRFRLENTGAAVSPDATSERWFRAFESTTTVIDPELGQGMGLGLYITRFVLDRRNATIKFVTPTEGFATAIEIDFGPSGNIKIGRSG